ncbi:CBS domain-containing protein [Paenibacillus sp. LMG 31456]|uniref:CBS domain-containing protein n=2 Tax=Paenibacillus foliorum TaxID=2654974 RepID=A0A972K2T5_9BACL|nr:CBS domain-containing protein [Paenibacillus foliorum]NOU95243.1 CBS domain-containing protein [Paenibacillus foliorum]
MTNSSGRESPLNAKKIKEIMTKDCATVTLKDNVYEVAVKMKQEDTGFIPVVDGKKLIGVITDRDLVIRGFAAKKEGSTAVAEVMSSNQITSATPETTVDEAAKLMASQQIRRLPVVENGELVGIVSIGDLAVRSNFEDEAGEALSEISEKDKVTV